MRPPTKVSSTSHSSPLLLPSFVPLSGACIASLRRCSMNHAVFCVTPRARCSSQLLTPFLQFVSSQSAGNHFCNGIGESSKIVPTLTLNWRLQLRHFQRF